MEGLSLRFDCILANMGGGALVDQAKKLGIATRALHPAAEFGTGTSPSRIDRIKRLLEALRNVFRIALIARRERVDLVHVNVTARLSLILGAWLSGRPVVVHVREVGNYLPPPRRLRRWAARLILRLPSHFICVSQAARKALLRAGGSAPAVVIPNGVDASKFERSQADRQRIRQSLGLSEDACLVGFVGKFSRRKGFDTFLAAAQALQHCDDLHFLAVGGRADEYSANVDHAGTSPFNLTVLGYTDDIADYLSGMDLFAMCSRQEPFARVNLEAAAAGCAVIASRVDGNLELFEEDSTALLFEPGDDKGLASAISTLANDRELRQQLGKNARQLVRDRFTLQACHQAIEKEFRKLLAIKGHYSPAG